MKMKMRMIPKSTLTKPKLLMSSKPWFHYLYYLNCWLRHQQPKFRLYHPLIEKVACYWTKAHLWLKMTSQSLIPMWLITKIRMTTLISEKVRQLAVSYQRLCHHPIQIHLLPN
ncbi:hypothetical protein BC829DRAFT_406375 [Chytridium lagenaria]|nr:hypothetical protein BC829DRAFT_406375 [Chytridium lagenaria]